MKDQILEIFVCLWVSHKGGCVLWKLEINSYRFFLFEKFEFKLTFCFAFPVFDGNLPGVLLAWPWLWLFCFTISFVSLEFKSIYVLKNDTGKFLTHFVFRERNVILDWFKCGQICNCEVCGALFLVCFSLCFSLIFVFSDHNSNTLWNMQFN